MYVGKQQLVSMIRSLYFIIPKKTLTVFLAIRNSFIFTYHFRIQHGAVSKIPYYHFYQKTLLPRIYQVQLNIATSQENDRRQNTETMPV